jgi:hypothetical protein
MTLGIMVEFCYAVSLILTVMYAECHKLSLYAECHYAECHCAECHCAECHYAECCCVECRGALW